MSATDTVAAYRLPFQARPQEMRISLGGVAYVVRTHWCDPAQCWLVDILRPDGTRLVSSLPLVTGADLLEQFEYLDLKGMLVVLSSNGPWDTLPSYDSLGVTSNVYYVPGSLA